jgi:hypothetical protein
VTAGAPVARDGRVEVRPLTFVPEGDEVMVGCPAVDSYAVFPPEGVAALRRLQAGDPPAAVADWFQREHGAELDLDDFLDTLAELGFLASGEEPAGAGPVRWQRLGRALFSPPAWAGYAALVAAAVVLAVRDPALRPTYSSVFFSTYATAIAVVLFLGQFPGLLLHESFHALAGRRLGLPSRLGIGHRLYFVVFETTLNGLLGVPKRQRYLPFLAGMVADVVLAAGYVVAAAALAGPLPLASAVCVALAFTTLLRFVWQFYFYLQTDLYYVITTAVGAVALQPATRALVGDTVRRLLRRPPVRRPEWTDRDRRLARWYAPLFLGGYALSLGLLVTVAVPVALHFAQRFLHRLAHGAPAAELLDTAVFTALTGAQFAVLAVLLLRRRRAARAGVLAD